MVFNVKICNLKKFPGTCPGWKHIAIDDDKGNPVEITVCCNRDGARDCNHGYYATLNSESIEWNMNIQKGD
jgi:hypothetical protein